MSNSLSTLRDRFMVAEHRLRSTLGEAFVTVGEALLEMQAVCREFGKTADGRAEWERLSECKTFEEYVRLEFQTTKQRAHQLMAASKVVRRMEQSQQAVDFAPPVTEAQCRYLALAGYQGKPLTATPAKLVEVWSEITERYDEYRAEKTAAGKRVSPHPPGTFILRHLAKHGYLIGVKVPEFIVGNHDARLVIQAGRRLSRAMQVLDKLNPDQPERFDEIVEREKWSESDRRYLVEQLDEVRRSADKCIGRVRCPEVVAEAAEKNKVVPAITSEKLRGAAVECGHGAINALCRLPRDEATRHRAFQIVADFIADHGGLDLLREIVERDGRPTP